MASFEAGAVEAL